MLLQTTDKRSTFVLNMSYHAHIMCLLADFHIRRMVALLQAKRATEARVCGDILSCFSGEHIQVLFTGSPTISRLFSVHQNRVLFTGSQTLSRHFCGNQYSVFHR